VNKESIMSYHKDNQYADTKKAEGCARLITDERTWQTTRKKATLIQMFQIQKVHEKNLKLEINSQNQIKFKPLRYNPAILTTTAHRVVLQSSDFYTK
jgi:hypothetical protein